MFQAGKSGHENKARPAGACWQDPYGLPPVSPGEAALLTPRQRSGDLRSRLCRFLSLNGTYDLTGT
jgi:hypothetical protein